jgi:creatinine amidohydrolase
MRQMIHSNEWVNICFSGIKIDVPFPKIYLAGEKMRLEELNWMDVRSYLQKDDRIMVVTGATEQHGYLSLLTDVKIPLALADAVGQETNVIVAPPLNFGISPYFLSYPGTISLRVSTFIDVIEDIVRSLYQHGFRRILFINGHSGNDPAKERLVEVANQLAGLKTIWYSWWTSHGVEILAQQNELKPVHASWLEAFPFTKVCELPKDAKTPPHYQGLLSAAETREVFGDGSFGGPYEVSPDIMNEIFFSAYQDLLHLLSFE